MLHSASYKFALAALLCSAVTACTPFPEFPALVDTEDLPPSTLVDLSTLPPPPTDRRDPAPAVLARAEAAKRRAAN